MVMARYSGVVQDQAGNIIPNAKIEVRREAPGAPLATLKEDRDGLVNLGNPFDAEADGSFAFHVIGGAYKVRAYVGASGAPTFEYIERFVANGTAAEHDTEDFVAARAVRERLTAPRTYYVASTGDGGSDSNSGLSALVPFLTIQKAIDTVAGLDIGIHGVTINVADGTYTGANLVSGPWLGSGVVSIVGNVTTPGNVIINPSGGTCFLVQNGGSLSIFGVETRGNVGLYARDSGIITVNGPVRFGPTNAYQVYATSNGSISIGSNYTISGGALAHMIAEFGGIIKATSLVITITGTPAFTTFAQATRSGSYIGIYLNTFSGSATGPRYNAASGSFIDVNLAGTSYLPGDSAGSGTNYGTAPYGLYQ